MTLDEFLPHLMVELNGVSEPLVKQTLLRTAIEFCQKSQCWVDFTASTPLVNGVSQYLIAAPADAKIFLILEVWFGRRALHPLTLQRQQVELPSAPIGAPEPTHFRSLPDRQGLEVFPTPIGVTSNSLLRSKVCYVPLATAATLPELLGDRYLTTVCAGTKAALLMMPGLPWSNPPLGAFYRTAFDDGILAAKLEAVYDAATNGTVLVPSRMFGF